MQGREPGGEPLILTARMEAEPRDYFDRLRREHFPAERNFVPAHLTLFHALPGGREGEIRAQLAELVRGESRMEGRTAELRNLGRGVAFVVECRPLVILRGRVAKAWEGELTRQDQQTPRLHITVQNKVDPEAARALLAQLRREFAPRAVRFEGLDLWRYCGGPWSLAESFWFQGAAG